MAEVHELMKDEGGLFIQWLCNLFNRHEKLYLVLMIREMPLQFSHTQGKAARVKEKLWMHLFVENT